jgi:ribose transport system permease protein
VKTLTRQRREVPDATTAVTDEADGGGGRLRTALAGIQIRRDRSGVWILNIALLIILAFAAPNFYSVGNLENVLNSTAFLGIVAAGMTVLIMAGAFDLSVTSVMGLAPIIAVSLVGNNNGYLLLVVAVVAGVACGLANGLIITRGNVVPFVATLGTLFIFGSIADIISNGNALVVSNTMLVSLGTGSLGPLLPYSFLVMLAVFALCYVIIRKLHIGRWIRAVGSNPRAAHASGINVRWVLLSLFVLSGVLTGLSGMLLSGYLVSADATQAPNYNLNAIAVVVVGGTSLRGGEGTLLGTALAAWLFAVVANGLTLIGLNSYWQYVATGVTVVLALVLGKIGLGGPLWRRGERPTLTPRRPEDPLPATASQK